MSTVIAHMRAAATLDEAARIAAELMRSMSVEMDSSARRRQDKLARWARDLEAAVVAANEERIDTELEEVPMQMGVQRMTDELRHRAAERAGKDGTASHMVEWQAAKRIEDYEAERRWLINENQRLRSLNASHLARVAVAEGTP
jgi:hypothetical protein